MEYKYDSETDILLIVLANVKPDFAEQEGNIINHYASNGKPVQIEILDASRTALKILEAIFKVKKATG